MINCMHDAAKQAGNILIEYFEKGVSRSFKNNGKTYESLVTEADIKSQQIIKETIISSLIKKGIPEKDIGFIGEESLHTSGNHLFIIDPLDGTTNFVYGIPYFCIAIAYIKNNELSAGVMYDPVTKTAYTAEIGKGAWKIYDNTKTKLLITQENLQTSILSAHYNHAQLDKQFQVYQKLVPNIAAIRTFGSLALELCFFADNKVHAIINGGCFIWDIAAAKLIIDEAGGKLIDWQGKEIELVLQNPKKKYEIIAAHKNSVDALVHLFA